MSVALTSSSTPTSTRQEPLRVMVVDDSRRDPRDDLALDRRRAGHGGRGLAAHRPRRRQPDRARQSRRCRARYRNAGARRHFGAAATAGEEARPHHHHGLDADPPQRGDQLQGAVARRVRLHSEAGKHARGRRRRDLPPRPDPEDPSSRRQGPPRARTPAASPPLAPAPERAREAAVRTPAAPHRLRSRNWCAARSACWRRACC